MSTPIKQCIACLVFACVVVSVLIVTGCDRDTRRVNQGAGGSSVERSQMLLTTVANQLADLPEQSILELRPPSVVLDASGSRDGEDILAKLVSRDPAKVPYDFALQIVSGNATFAKVRSGDTVRWYGRMVSEVDSEFGSSKNQLNTNIMLNVLDATPEQQRQSIEQFSRSSDPSFVKMSTELKRILALPAERRDEIKESMQQELMLTGDILTAKAYELTVAQVQSGPDANTLLFDPSKLSQAEFLMMPRSQEEGEGAYRLEVLRYRDTRFQDLIIDNKRYAKRGDPLLGWEPSPDQMAITQMVERLNQWLRQSSNKTDWAATPLLDKLPESLRGDQLDLLFSAKALERNAFSLSSAAEQELQATGYEGRLLQEASWMRDISRWLTLGEREPARQVDRLFDWTVRTLQLDDPTSQLLPYRPWQALIHGHATAEGRAWVFAQLCRQLELPTLVLNPAGEKGPVWCGVLVEGEIYLYDPQLGLSLLNSDGKTATLKDLQADPKLASQFDLDDDPYLPGEVDWEQLTYQIVAGPFALSKRAALLEERLTGNDALLLLVDTEQVAEQLQQSLGSEPSLSLWSYPFQLIAQQVKLSEGTEKVVGRADAALEFEPYVYRPRLWKARLLHFRGLEGETVDAGRGNLKTETNDHRTAGQLYNHSKVRPTQSTIDKQQAREVRRAWTAAKQNATYWVGLLSYDRGNYQVAADWLSQAAEIERWQSAANYNLARAYEALGQTEKAIELLEQSTGPQARGNQLRVQRLRAE